MTKHTPPMGSTRREDNYRRQNQGHPFRDDRPLTVRQLRQIRRMKRKNGEK